MKILQITNLTFLLDDDFDGNFNDALRSYLKYREKNPEHCPEFPKIQHLLYMIKSTDMI